MTDFLNMLHHERATLVRKLAGVDVAIYGVRGADSKQYRMFRRNPIVRKDWTSAFFEIHRRNHCA
jgi:hypothetical protein